MSKVLVLYYSAYGHIEAMANAVAEGARETGAQVEVRRVPELVPEEIAAKSHYKLDQPAANREDRRSRRLRRDHHRRRHPVRPTIVANGEFPRSGRRTLGAWRADRQGRRRLHFDWHATRRSGDDAVLDHRQSVAFRHGDRRPRLRLRRADDARRDHRRLTIWRDNDRRPRRLASTDRERTRRAPDIRAAGSRRSPTSCMAERRDPTIKPRMAHDE